MACSSRSAARVTGCCGVNPARRSTYHTVDSATLLWNIRPISVRTRDSVHRWSSIQPAARRSVLQLRDQLGELRLGQHPLRARRALGYQGLLTAGGPGPPPRVRGLGRHLQRGRDLPGVDPVGEHRRRLPSYLFPAGAGLRPDPTPIAVSHAP
jgi:hypothetical protein